MTRRCPVAHEGARSRPLLERGPGIVRHGYPYLLRLRQSAATAEIRLLGRRATVVSGRDGAEFFYDESLMRRAGAIPGPLRRTLFGDGAVHGLDGSAHRQRKTMFTGLLTLAAARDVATRADRLWRERDRGPTDPVSVFGEAVEVHFQAICAWAGVPPGAVDARLGRDLAAIVDGFGGLGRRHLRARRARRRAERWATTLIEHVRSGDRTPDGAALAVVARHREPDGSLLGPRVAGVELLNMLRPTVATAYYVAATVHRLRLDPMLRFRIAAGAEGDLEAFAHEVRRVYPFVPMLAARTVRPATHDGHRLPAGRRVLLDVYGTLHDPRRWKAPERFDIERFVGVVPDAFGYLPQGGGDPTEGHRCPGERVVIELIKVAARMALERGFDPGRAGVVPLDRMPTRPVRASRGGR